MDKAMHELENVNMKSADDVRVIKAELKMNHVYNLYELMGMIQTDDVEKCLEQIIERTHHRETNSRPFKSRIADRRKLLMQELEEVNEKLNSGAASKISSFFGANKDLKKKKEELKARLDEQLLTYRRVTMID